MITSSNHSSRHLLRKALVLPALLAVMILSCSKEQGVATVKIPSPPPLSLSFKALPKNLVLTKLNFRIKDGSLKTVNIIVDTSRSLIREDHDLKGYIITSDGKPDVN